MIVRVIQTAISINADKIVIVTGKHKVAIMNTVQSHIDDQKIVYVEQPVPIGTGHAVRCCASEFTSEDRVLILNGDMPLIKPSLLQQVVEDKNQNIIISAYVTDPHGYGRILYDNYDRFIGIIEEKDCTEEQRKIKEINSGVYLFSGKVLHNFLPKIKNENNQKEYYLTDIVKIAKEEECNIYTYLIDYSNNYQIMGVNTPEELQELSKFV
jgi:bifunctional N-acetylglucosamine-1-phosphate-uridyltransferase/glucosamine-1-phosphate-acetyltransferase GlmU-like protein